MNKVCNNEKKNNDDVRVDSRNLKAFCVNFVFNFFFVPFLSYGSSDELSKENRIFI